MNIKKLAKRAAEKRALGLGLGYGGGVGGPYVNYAAPGMRYRGPHPGVLSWSMANPRHSVGYDMATNTESYDRPVSQNMAAMRDIQRQEGELQDPLLEAQRKHDIAKKEYDASIWAQGERQPFDILHPTTWGLGFGSGKAHAMTEAEAELAKQQKAVANRQKAFEQTKTMQGGEFERSKGMRDTTQQSLMNYDTNRMGLMQRPNTSAVTPKTMQAPPKPTGAFKLPTAGNIPKAASAILPISIAQLSKLAAVERVNKWASDLHIRKVTQQSR